jgi:MerR family transcriptional regulator, redox-sensitive transcriptional activator SoxR
MNEPLTIGQLAQRYGLTTSAIRYYEPNGVLPQPARVSGQRRYGPDAVRRLEVLDVAKRAGFSLDEARVLLETAQAGTPAFEALRALAAHKLPDVKALIKPAEAMRAWLLTATDCSCTSLEVCALFDRDERPRMGPTARSGCTSRTSGAWPPAPSRGLVALEERS